MSEGIKWPHTIVVWENGASFQFAPYANYGFTSCVRQGLTKGRVILREYMDDVLTKETEVESITEDPETGLVKWKYKD